MDENTRQHQALLRRQIKSRLVQLVKGRDYAQTLADRLYAVLTYQDIILNSMTELKKSWDRVNLHYETADGLSDDPSESLEFYLEKYDIPIITQNSRHNPNAAMDPEVREFAQKELHRILTDEFRNPRTETKHVPTMRLDSTMLCLCTAAAGGVGEYIRQGFVDDRFKQFEDHAKAADTLKEYSGPELEQLMKEMEPQMYDCGVSECPITRELRRIRDTNNPASDLMGADSNVELRRPPGSHCSDSKSSDATVDGDVVIRNQEVGQVVFPLPEAESSTPKVISRNEKNREKKASKKRVKQQRKQQLEFEELRRSRAASPHFKDSTPQSPKEDASRAITSAENTPESATSKVSLDSTEQVIPNFARLEAALESTPSNPEAFLQSGEREGFQDSTPSDAPLEVTRSKPEASLESIKRGVFRRHMSEEPLVPAKSNGIHERELPRDNPSNKWWATIMEEYNWASAAPYPVAATDPVDTEPRQPVVQRNRTDPVIINSTNYDRMELAEEDAED